MMTGKKSPSKGSAKPYHGQRGTTVTGSHLPAPGFADIRGEFWREGSPRFKERECQSMQTK